MQTREPEAAFPASRQRRREATPRFDWVGAVLVAGAKLVFGLATANLYGLHRDEFYYLACGRHLAAGYVDQPPLTPWAYRGWTELFGASQFSLHSMAAVLGVPMVLLGALLAREFGGGRWAQRASMTVAAIGTVFTTTFHFVGTETFDLLAWSAATWLLIRLLRTADTRLWPAIGLTVGIGFENKHTMVVWAAAVGLGLLVSPRRRLLASPCLAVALVVFLGLAAPNLAWQATHHWTSLSFYRALRHRTEGQNLVQYWLLQAGLMSPIGTVVLVWGLTWLRREPEARAYRPLLVAFLVVVFAFFVTGGKGYYPAGIYLPVVAAGAVWMESEAASAFRRRVIGGIIGLGVIVATAFTPILPASVAVDAGLTQANADLGGMMGWHQVVDQLAGVYRQLPATQRLSAVYLTRDYSEAGAITYWRASEHIPPAISGHNSYWWWGWAPAAHARTVIVVGIERRYLTARFASVRPAGRLAALHGPIDPEQAGLPIWICTGQRHSWASLWPGLREYA